MRKSRRLIVVFLLLFLWAGNYVHTAVYYAFEGESSASIIAPDVYLEEGTAGTSVVYPNATSAASQVDSHATTFYPNDYNVTHGVYDSGSTPSSVNQLDSDYFTVNSSGSHTSNLVYHPVSFTPLNGTSTSFDWGINTTSFTQSSVHTNYRYMGGTSPAIPNMKVKSLHIRTTGAGTVAIALYTGGALNDPTGAVKRTEAYNVAVSAGWNEIDVTDYNWASNTVTWIGWAHNTGVYYSTSSGDAGDFQTVRGRWSQTAPADADETAAMPNNPGAGSFNNFWYAVYVEYEVGSISNLTADDGEFMRFKSYLSASSSLEDSVDNDSSDVDASPDKGFYTNFTLQQVGPDSQYDVLREEYFGNLTLDYVDNNITDVDSSAGKGTHSNFANQQSGPDAVYDTLTEEKNIGVALSVEELAIDLSTVSTSNTATLTEASNTSQVVPFATKYVPTEGGTMDNHESTLIDISISGSTVTASRDETDSKQVNTSIYCVEFDPSINVYSGTFSIASGSATGTANIGATISQTKSFLVFYYQASGTGDNHPDNAVRGYFSSTTQITFSRAGTTGSISGHWWVVEDTGSNFDVDAVDVTVTGTSNTGTFSAVDMSRTMVVGSYSGGSTDDIIYGAVSMYLSSTTEVTVLRGGTTGTIESTVYVIEIYDGTSVQRGDISYTGAQTSLTDPLTPVAVGDSMAWIPSGWINTGHCTAGGTGSSDNLDVMIRVRLTSDIEITGERNNNGFNDAVLHWEVVEWAVGVNLQLDLEAQWTNVPNGYLGTEVAIKTGSYNGTEQLQFEFWNSTSQWQTLGYLASGSWNNFTIGSYLASSNFTVRFKGASETGDSVKDTWQIDASLIRLLGWIESEDPVDNDTSDVDSSVDRGSLIDFNNMKSMSLGYSTLSETQSSVSLAGSDESWSAAGASSHSFQYDLQSGAGHNRLVVVTVAWEDAQASASASVTFDGVAMAEVATVTVGVGYSAYAGMWYMNESLLPATTGNKWIIVTVSEAITREIYVTVAEYTGVAQEAPDDFATDSNTSGGDTAVTLSVADNGSIIVAAGAQGGTNSWANTNNLANIEDAILTSFGGALGHYENAPSGNIVVGWNALGTREGMAGAVWSAAYYSTDYRLDQEVQWTDLTYDLPNEELCIYAGSTGAEDLNVEVWNTTASDWDLLFSDLTASSWNNISITDYLTSDTLTVRFVGSTETGDGVQDQWEIDVALIHVWNSGIAEYSLDMEYRWTDARFYESGEELCIYGGTMGAENILVDVWYDDAWNNVFVDLSPGWNNVSVTQYLNSSIFTIRVRDGNPTSDAVFDTWEIDVSLLHVWGATYTAEVEFEGTSNLYEWTQIEWTVDSAYTNASVRVDIQLYNYSGGAYPASGDGFTNYTSGPANTDETVSQVITNSPMNFRNATSGWSIKVRGEHTSQFDMLIDYIALNTTYYDEYTAQTEFIFTDITDNQSPNLNFIVANYNSVNNVNMTIQVYNYTSGSYPTSGQGYLNYVSNWLAGWDQRVKLTIDHNDVDSDLSDFPALIHLSTSSGRNSDDVSFVFDELQNDANRLKIAVTIGDGATQCYVEIEEWDDANEEAWLWAKAPSVNSTIDTTLYLYYDADHADNTAYVGDPDSSPAEAVWANDFRLVSHMRDDPDTSHIRDSTGYDNDGTKTGANEPVVTIGNVSDAQSFDGSDDYVNLGSDSSLDLRGTDFTIEAWIYPTTQSTRWPTIYTVGTWEISLGIGQDTNTDKLEAWVNDNDDYASDSDVTYNAWNYVVLSWDGSHYNFFIDGAADGSRSGSAYPDTGTTYIGGIPPWENEDCFNGTIDEVRASNTSRTSSWIKTCFESGRDDLVDFGGEDTYTKWLNITNNAQSCLSGSYARIRVTSEYSTTEYYQQLTDFVRLLQEESTLVNDYALRVTNNGTDLYTVRLVRVSDSNIDRIINCTIYFRSGETQLQVIDGAFTLTTGTWANLPAASSLDILIDASTIHLQYASVIETELEVLRSGTSIYTKFPIQFTIT